MTPGFYFLLGSNVSFKTVSGESNAATLEIVAAWDETKLPTLLCNYSLENMHNTTEYGRFYQCLPNNVQVVNTAKSESLV